MQICQKKCKVMLLTLQTEDWKNILSKKILQHLLKWNLIKSIALSGIVLLEKILVRKWRMIRRILFTFILDKLLYYYLKQADQD